LGRVSEGSEDAYLGSQIAKAMVRGINKMICQKTIDFILRETFCFVWCLRSGSTTMVDMSRKNVQ
jgi:hypothetical protein